MQATRTQGYAAAKSEIPSMPAIFTIKIMIEPTSGKACYLSEHQVRSNVGYGLRFHIIQVHKVT